MSQQRHRRQVSSADRRTLLRLMSDDSYQHTKLGAAFPPDQQRRSSLFWQLAAAYLEQPLLRVMLAGSSLRAEADVLWRQHRERQRLQRVRVTAAASRPRPKAAAAQASTPAAEPARPTPALRGEEAAAGGSSSGSGSKCPRKEKGERQRHSNAASAEAAAAAERSRSMQAQAPAGAAEPQRPAAKKKRRRLKEKGTSSAPAGLGAPPSAAVPRQAAPAAAPAAEGHQPPAKKRRREAGSSKPTAAGTDAAPHAAEAAAQEQQQARRYDPYSGAFAAFRPQAAAAGQQQQGSPSAEQPSASDAQHGPFSGAFAAFAPSPGPAAVDPAAAALAGAAPVAAALAVARTRPPAANRRWRPEADAELQQLVDSAEHRQRVLGSAELDWEAIGRHFGRSASAAQDHYYRLRRAASGVQPAAGSAIAAGSKRTAPSEEAGRLVGSGSTAAAAAQPVRAAITIGLPPPAAQQHESPPFVGVHPVASSRLPWASHAMIQSKLWHLASCASRAAAAAAHDVARIWCSLHGKEVGNGGTNVNFPQLLEDAGLEQQLRAVPDVPALQAFMATWLSQQWPQLEADMLAGRAAALDRYIAANEACLGVRPHGQGWQARIQVLGKLWALGTWPSEAAAGIVRDVSSVWRSLHASNTQASQLYNRPQLRLWQDAALVASLRRIQSGAQLQVFVKAWAEEHLPAMLAELA